MRRDRFVEITIPPELVLWIETAFFFWYFKAYEHAMLGAGFVHIHQLSRVSVANQKVAIIETELNQLMNDGQK